MTERSRTVPREPGSRSARACRPSGPATQGGPVDLIARGRIVAWSPVEDLIAYAGGSRIAVIRSDGTGDRKTDYVTVIRIGERLTQ